MTEHDINNKYLEEKFYNLEQRLNTVLDVANQNLTQAKETNGRVKRLEIWQATVKGSLSTMKGIWGMSGLSFIAVIGFVVWMYVQVQSIPDKNEMQRIIEDQTISFLENVELEVYEAE